MPRALFRVVTVLLGLSGGVACLAQTSYAIIGHIAVPDGRWDYGVVDAAVHRLYLARVGGVLVVDLGTGQVTAPLVTSALVHGVVALGAGLLMASDGEADTVTLFEGATGQVLARIPTGREPDAILRDAATGLVVTTNEGSHDLTLIDVAARRVVATVALPGKPEYATAGTHGLLYDNIEDRDEIAVIDLAARRVVRTISLPGCRRPTGLAYDQTDDLLVSVCRNGVAKFIRARDGGELATLPVGEAPDAVLWDATRHRVFVPAGGPGTLTVFAVHGSQVTRVQTIVTRPGSRTAVLDPVSGRVYVPAAAFATPSAPDAQPAGRSGSFEILVIGPTP